MLVRSYAIVDENVFKVKCDCDTLLYKPAFIRVIYEYSNRRRTRTMVEKCTIQKPKF